MSLGAGGAAEEARLAAISGSADDATLAVLRPLVSGGAVVLDVGCGNASVAVRLAAETGAREVLALDQDLALLPDPLPPRVRPVEADVLHWVPDRRFDVLHARFVLAHLARREDALRRMISWLAPGGHLVVTEAHQLSYGADPRVAEVLRAYREVAEVGGMSFGFARRLPGLLVAGGLVGVRVTARPSRLGGGPGVDRWAPLVRHVEHLLDVSPAALLAFHEFAAAPDTFDIPQIVLTATGSKVAGFRS